MANSEMVTIPMTEYLSLKEDSLWRSCVEDAGVDNWEGFSYAMRDFYSEDDDD